MQLKRRSHQPQPNYLTKRVRKKFKKVARKNKLFPTNQLESMQPPALSVKPEICASCLIFPSTPSITVGLVIFLCTMLIFVERHVTWMTLGTASNTQIFVINV